MAGLALGLMEVLGHEARFDVEVEAEAEIGVLANMLLIQRLVLAIEVLVSLLLWLVELARVKVQSLLFKMVGLQYRSFR